MRTNKRVVEMKKIRRVERMDGIIKVIRKIRYTQW